MKPKSKKRGNKSFPLRSRDKISADVEDVSSLFDMIKKRMNRKILEQLSVLTEEKTDDSSSWLD